MSLFIPQLLIISAFGLIVQTASVNLIKRSTANNQTVLENKLYCAAELLYNARGSSSAAEYNTENSTANTLFSLLSDRCKEFTIAMILKHQLQYNLFNNYTAPDLGLNAEDPKNLSLILISLQTMVNTFNDMEFNEKDQRCIKLLPAQYKIMYKARYNTPLLQSLGDLAKWYLNPDLYLNLQQDC